MGISLFLSIENQYESLRRVNSIPVMNLISHQIEDQVINHQITADFFAGFQRFSHFPEQLRRYSRLGAVCRRVYVFGIPDCEPPAISGLEFLELAPASSLAQEWFLLVNTPTFWATLVAREVDGQDPVTKSRRFDAVWSYDVEVVERVALLTSQMMEQPYQPIRDRDYARQNFHISEMNSSMVNQIEGINELSQRRWSRLQTLQALSAISAQRLMPFLEESAKVLLEVFGATGVAIAFQVDNDSYKVVVAAGEAMGKGWGVHLTDGICGKSIRESRPVRYQDISHSQRFDSQLPTAKCLIAAPIHHHKQSGVVALGHPTPNMWDEEDLDMLETAGRFMAIGIRQFVRHVQSKLKSQQQQQQETM
ncbi:GAF domain-containing protein [Leptolyngbyaceae cyanobacterium CCMR0082]|uniref:GAF domain-containing protein n=2 Tax=Adonisia turfae TaxID=2950184 RepID=A0A6M0SAZ1_9CYAN|nr:DICT sensory domain-containing protein [Adonisia turfae]MDV3349830.1 DICT sensory domain-containing protein [Leptothoe sp. LEGE 181152]NEZ56029.1 GAF domain-containing protein [Adonisia turfae CCMR0081]NEZ65253.1 GAF domain-containing protein [Adonisia turfae CCMR0082]